MKKQYKIQLPPQLTDLSPTNIKIKNGYLKFEVEDEDKNESYELFTKGNILSLKTCVSQKRYIGAFEEKNDCAYLKFYIIVGLDSDELYTSYLFEPVQLCGCRLATMEEKEIFFNRIYKNLVINKSTTKLKTPIRWRGHDYEMYFDDNGEMQFDKVK